MPAFTRLCVTAALLLIPLLPAPAAGGPALADLREVAVEASLLRPLEGLTSGVLTALVADALRRLDPPLAVSASAADRVRLHVFVHPTNATTLRGFWLPFSGTYGVGGVRLSVERAVIRPGAAAPFPGVVWQTERAVATPWKETAAEVGRLVEEMVADLGAAKR